MKERKITGITKFAYGCGNLLGSGPLAITSAWLLIYLTTVCQIDPVAAATVVGLPTLFDVILNPVMGFVTDNFYKTAIGRKFGRRRFFILIGIPLMLLYPLIWYPTSSVIYHLLTFLAFELVYTSVMIPYETLAVEMTSDFNERTYLTGFKAAMGKVANFLASGIPALFFLIFGEGTAESQAARAAEGLTVYPAWAGYVGTAVAYCAIMMISLALLYFNSWERAPEEVKNENVKGLGEGLKKLYIDNISTLRLKVFRHHLGMYLFGFGSEWLFASTFTYYIVYVIGQQKTLAATMNSWSAVCQLISTFIAMAVIAKIGFKKPYILGLAVVILAVLGYIFTALFGYHESVVLIIVITTIFGLGTGTVYYIPWSTYTFMADVDELVTDRRREGVYAGAMTMAGKFMRFIVVQALGIVLAFGGFDKKADVQPDSAITAILGVLLIGVCGLAVIGIYFTLRMKLDHHTHQVVIDEIARVHAGGRKEDVKPEVKKICEDLSGFKYEDCFGNNDMGYHEGDKFLTAKNISVLIILLAIIAVFF
ncbi:MAG: MFS transporter, partial [Lachnospirales bacterium]